MACSWCSASRRSWRSLPARRKDRTKSSSRAWAGRVPPPAHARAAFGAAAQDGEGGRPGSPSPGLSSAPIMVGVGGLASAGVHAIGAACTCHGRTPGVEGVAASFVALPPFKIPGSSAVPGKRPGNLAPPEVP